VRIGACGSRGKEGREDAHGTKDGPFASRSQRGAEDATPRLTRKGLNEVLGAKKEAGK